MLGNARYYLEKLEKSYNLVEKRFCEGLAIARDGAGVFHVTYDGRPAYNMLFEEAKSFQEGSAPVKLDGRWFHIRRDGSRLYDTGTDFLWASWFKRGLAMVQDQAGLFHIRPDGTELYSERYYSMCGDGIPCDGYRLANVSTTQGDRFDIDYCGRQIY